MKEEMFEIKNRKGQKIVGSFAYPESTVRGAPTPVILCHGFKGFMDLPWHGQMAKFLVAAGYAVFRFDFTNGLGRSEGDIKFCTVSHYVEDLLCVVDDVCRQTNLALEKLTVFGTSMGGLVSVAAAEREPRIRNLVIHSAALDWNIIRTHPDIVDWKEGKSVRFVSKSRGFEFDVNFSLVTDGLKYDGFRILQHLKIPLLVIHSGQDEAIPLEFSQRAFRDSASSRKELFILSGAPHTPKDLPIIKLTAEKIDSFLQVSD